MPDTQYELFQELDRHCVARGMPDGDCRAAIMQKRRSIDAERQRNNPVVREVLEGRTTFVALYDGYSHAFRGVRRFLPMPHNPAHNERLEQFGCIVPNVRHFMRRSLFATDNPVGCTVYGVIVAFAIATVWTYSTRSDAAEPAAGLDLPSLALLVGACAAAGFLAGLLAALKYRTRDPKVIHAREAAEYMDLNYHCYRSLDDAAWAGVIARKSAVSPCHMAEAGGIAGDVRSSPPDKQTAVT